MMKKITTLVVATALMWTFTNRQSYARDGSNYSSAIGVRLGAPTGVSLKHFISPHGALEAIGALYWWGAVNVTGLYEYHGDIGDVTGLRWLIGGGADLTIFNTAYYGTYTGTAIGVDFILGLDYKINSAPIDISLDWKPSFFVTGVNHFYGSGGALSIRYTF